MLRTEGKQFRQPGNNKDRSLYHADRINRATTVYVVEGEEDVHAVEAVGGVAVCSAMGAGKADKFDWSPLTGLGVVIIADKDKPGRDHAAKVAALLDGIASAVEITEAAVGKDVSDHIAAGCALDELVPLDPNINGHSLSEGEGIPLPTEPPDRPGEGQSEGNTARPTGEGTARLHLRDRLLTLDELGKMPPSIPLIGGLLYRNTLAQLSGGPGSYKTFLALSMACCVARGTPLGDFAVPERGKVVIAAAEGANGIHKRILAWCEAWDVEPDELRDWLHILPAPIQLGSTVDVGDCIDVVTELDASLLILDTRARCTLGLEENSATEQGRAIAAVDRIRDAAECTVLGVHHTPRTGTAGRGSNAWDGAVWSDLRVDGDKLQAKVHCEKHKDVESGCDHHFAFQEHTVSQHLLPDLDREARKTLVLCPTGGRDITVRLATARQAVVGLVWDLAPPEGLTANQIQDMTEVSKSRMYDATAWGIAQGHLRNIGTPKRSRYAPGKTRPPWLPAND